MTERFASDDPHARVAARALRVLLGKRYADRFAIELWDGSRIDPETRAEFTLGVRSPEALRFALRPPVDLHAGRAFAAGMLTCEGDVEAAFDLFQESGHGIVPIAALRAYALLRRLPAPRAPQLQEARLRGRMHSLARDRQAIGFHYDHPVAFYRAILGDAMVYSCAYFDDAIANLTDAQYAKIDYVLHKLRVKPGERLLDIGCGWGTLVARAAQRFGAKAVGITLSAAQHAEGNQLLERAGLAGSARIELMDYRDIAAASFDKIVSIGMFEHVGRSKMRAYFAKAYAALRPGGLFLNHAISLQTPGRRDGKSRGFMDRFVFPDGELVAVGDAVGVAERVGFELRDAENLREHYVRTLRAWVANIEANRASAVTAAGEQAFRTWRLYMAGSAQGFRTGRLGLFQALFSKPNPDGSAEVPPTRRDLYARSIALECGDAVG